MKEWLPLRYGKKSKKFIVDFSRSHTCLANILIVSLLIIAIAQNLYQVVPSVLAHRDGIGLDFDVYYGASVNYRSNLSPYAHNPHSQMLFIYPPASLLFFLPLILLPLPIANIAMIIISYLSLAGIIYLLLKLQDTYDFRWQEWIILLSFCIQTFTFKFNIGMGQINVLVLFLIILGLYLCKRHQFIFAAFCLAFASGLKLTPLFLLPYFVIKKQGRVVGYWLMLLLLLHLPFSKYNVDYYTQILGQISGSGWYDQSLVAMLERWWGENGYNQLLVIVGSAVSYLTILFFVGKNKIKSMIVPLILLCIGVFAHSPVWAHYLIYLIPLIIWGFRKNWEVLLLFWLLLQLHTDQTMTWLTDYPYLISYGTYAYLLVLILLLAKSKLKLGK